MFADFFFCLEDEPKMTKYLPVLTDDDCHICWITTVASKNKRSVITKLGPEGPVARQKYNGESNFICYKRISHCDSLHNANDK